ncbi:MAG TPA: hypothetical protein PLO05_06375, partial [Bacteroidales bacterium]|nr:hypothetical protein [Bacteroidales bacterium]
NSVFTPKNFSPEELNEFFIKTNTYYYNQKNTLKRFIRTVKSTKSLKSTTYLYLWAINNYSNLRGYWHMKIFQFFVKIFLK